MAKILLSLVLAATLLLSGCGRLLGSGGQPIPGPTPTGTGGTGIPVSGPDEGADPADEAITDGPDVTG